MNRIMFVFWLFLVWMLACYGYGCHSSGKTEFSSADNDSVDSLNEEVSNYDYDEDEDCESVYEEEEFSGCIDGDAHSHDEEPYEETAEEYSNEEREIEYEYNEYEMENEDSGASEASEEESFEYEQENTEVEDIAEIGSEDDMTDEELSLRCPEEMALVRNGSVEFCIDKWEASRPDATSDSMGSDTSMATSRQGVIPWFPVTYDVAKSACEAAGKRLCRTDEWVEACSGHGEGAAHTVYSYGDGYSPTVCNGIDKFCNCSPYPGCYTQCGANFHYLPTGSLPECTNEYGVFDINGNVWELVEAGDGREHFRGGAYNCRDSKTLHRCDYDATWGPSAKGFRCCKNPN